MIGLTDERPWETWTILDEREGFKVKRIEVKPYSRLSYQTHEHRAEVWVVAAGTASAVIDGQTVIARVGEAVTIAIGQPHRIVNDHDDPLLIIEVQLGKYLGEDDIVRLQDDFGRV
ncbi:phosphomannose isomerase type II C-terminal cupin domain [Rathayibacter soli]|uniref:phosphomannose isomerase type II C-terminal cupin domain n=1 Tax=Rathayibacter soli TaxID=3144168 RepID=UPI0027E59F87|nr:phosphomannose isomerase type II C-terminal cupin domain [Glaciibacter superstes]